MSVVLVRNDSTVRIANGAAEGTDVVGARVGEPGAIGEELGTEVGAKVGAGAVARVGAKLGGSVGPPAGIGEGVRLNSIGSNACRSVISSCTFLL